MSRFPCPQADVLSEFSSGEMNAERRVVVEQHVAECPKCQAALETWEGHSRTIIQSDSPAGSGVADAFDPLHTWLGIPPHEQPPDHYRLLGLTRFETNLSAIEHAADRQMGHVRTFQTGKNAAAAQRLLNDLSRARVCLLNPQSKEAYDAELRQKLATKPLPVADPPAAPTGKSPKTADELAHVLAEIGLLSADNSAILLRKLSPRAKLADAVDFGKLLVEHKKLTAFQAQECLQGRAAELILGDRELQEVVGIGGMGKVYRARHRRLDRMEAVKVINAKRLSAPNAIGRFEKEARAAARVTHPNLVATFDAGKQGNTLFLAMEFVSGHDLGKRVKTSGPLSVSQTVSCIVQAAQGLQEAHDAGIVHRDIKPHNLLMDDQGRVKVLDLGLARLTDDESSLNMPGDGFTGEGIIAGTVDFMSPEQADNTRSADARSDVYSLGCTLHYLLTGKPPYAGETPIQRIIAHRERPVPSLQTARADVPAWLDAAFQKMCAKQPADRFQSMSEVIAALSRGGAASESHSAADMAALHAIATQSFTGTTSRPASVTRTAATSRSRSFWPMHWIVTAAGVAILLLGSIAAAFSGVLTFQTPQGEVVVEIDDVLKSDVEVRLLQNGNVVEVIDKKDQWKISLAQGEYQVQVKGGGDDVRVSGDKVTVNRSGKAVVRVEKKVGLEKPFQSANISHSQFNALSFDGVDDYVDIMSDWSYAGGDFTFELWGVLGKHTQMDHCLFCLDHGTEANRFSCRVLQNNHIGEVFLVCRPPLTKLNIFPAPPADGVASHVAIVWRPEGGTVFVNGKQLASLPDRRFGFGKRNGNPFCWIGAYPTTGEHKFAKQGWNGSMYQVRLSSKAIYDKNFNPPNRFPATDDTIALYLFEEGEGTILIDSSGHKRHGKIVGAKWIKSREYERQAILNNKSAEKSTTTAVQPNLTVAAGKVSNTADGPYQQFDLSVTNRSQLPAGDYGVDIVDAAGKHVYGFVSLSRESLNEIWFGRPAEKRELQQVRVVLTRRSDKTKYTSNLATVPWPNVPSSETRPREEPNTIAVSLPSPNFRPTPSTGGSWAPFSVGLSQDRPEAIKKEPVGGGADQWYGAVRLGVLDNRDHYFRLDNPKEGKSLLHFDVNKDGDLTNDGPGIPNSRPGIFGARIRIPWTMLSSPALGNSDDMFEIDFHINASGWERKRATFYSCREFVGSVNVNGKAIKAVIAEQRIHDGDFTNDGIALDLNGDGLVKATDGETPNTVHTIDGKDFRFAVRFNRGNSEASPSTLPPSSLHDAAKQLLGKGARLNLRADGRLQQVFGGQPLPTGLFDLSDITFTTDDATDEELALLPQFPTLRYVAFDKGRFTQAGLGQLKAIKKLDAIHAHASVSPPEKLPVFDEKVKVFMHFKSAADFTPESVKATAMLSKDVGIHLHRFEIASESAVMAKALPSIKNLFLDGATRPEGWLKRFLTGSEVAELGVIDSLLTPADVADIAAHPKWTKLLLNVSAAAMDAPEFVGLPLTSVRFVGPAPPNPDDYVTRLHDKLAIYSIDCGGWPVTDAIFPSLVNLPLNARPGLVLRGSRVTDAGVAEFMKLKPKCSIVR